MLLAAGVVRRFTSAMTGCAGGAPPGNKGRDAPSILARSEHLHTRNSMGKPRQTSDVNPHHAKSWPFRRGLRGPTPGRKKGKGRVTGTREALRGARGPRCQNCHLSWLAVCGHAARGTSRPPRTLRQVFGDLPLLRSRPLFQTLQYRRGQGQAGLPDRPGCGMWLVAFCQAWRGRAVRNR